MTDNLSLNRLHWSDAVPSLTWSNLSKSAVQLILLLDMREIVKPIVEMSPVAGQDTFAFSLLSPSRPLRGPTAARSCPCDVTPSVSQYPRSLPHTCHSDTGVQLCSHLCGMHLAHIRTCWDLNLYWGSMWAKLPVTQGKNEPCFRWQRLFLLNRNGLLEELDWLTELGGRLW